MAKPRKPAVESQPFKQYSEGGVTVLDRKLSPSEAAEQDRRNLERLARERARRFGVVESGETA